MQLPQPLAEGAMAVPVSGIGGGTRGRFAAGDYRGSFARSEKRLAFFGIAEKNYGHSTFTIEGPAIGKTIEAECRMREKVLDFGIAEFVTRPMAYRCEFTADGRAFPARFELQESKSGPGDALSRTARRGEIALGGETVQIRSVHQLSGSPFAMAQPIGYLFEQGGRPVGAVELNGAPRLFIAPEADHGLARTLTVAAIALGIFWDPANSALDS